MILFHDPLYEIDCSDIPINEGWRFNYNLLALYYHNRKYSEKELKVLKFILYKYGYTKKELIKLVDILLIHGRISSIDFIDKYIL